MTEEAFHGIRVLDTAQGLAGPYCAGILAAQGAEVVKVEPPGGDWGRRIGPAYGDFTSFSIVPNLRKRSICVDVRQALGRGVVAKLATDTDVFVQSSRPGVAERLGIDYKTLSARNPRLIYVSVSGFGSSGPWSQRPGTDTVLQGLTGLMSRNADSAGVPRPVRFSLIDVVAGIYAAERVAAALYQRHLTHRGQHVEMSLLEAALNLQSVPLVDAAMTRGKAENDRPATLSAPGGQFETADGYLSLSCTSDKMFHSICSVIGRPDWMNDPTLSSPTQRLARAQEINAVVADVLRGKASSFWLRKFTDADVLCGPIYSYPDVIDDETMRHLGMFTEFDVDAAPFHSVAPRTPGGATTSDIAPSCGEHTEEVLRERGWTEHDLQELVESNAIKVFSKD